MRRAEHRRAGMPDRREATLRAGWMAERKRGRGAGPKAAGCEGAERGAWHDKIGTRQSKKSAEKNLSVDWGQSKKSAERLLSVDWKCLPADWISVSRGKVSLLTRMSLY